MRRSVGQRVRYRFDNTISRGTVPVIGYLTLITIAFVIIAAVVNTVAGSQVGPTNVVAAGRARGEVAIGYRRAHADNGAPQVVMNPPKSTELTLGRADQIVVIGLPE